MHILNPIQFAWHPSIRNAHYGHESFLSIIANIVYVQLMSPNGYSSNYCLDQAFPPAASGHNGPNFGATFPAMSVNVSMNMTMGYLPPDPSLQHQVNNEQCRQVCLWFV